MASNINIQKKCEWCGKLFIAHKISTRCCSRRCANLAYKEKTRQKRVSEFQTMVNQQIEKEDCIDKWKLIEKHAISVASDKIAAHIPVKSPHAH